MDELPYTGSLHFVRDRPLSLDGASGKNPSTTSFYNF